jgi:hypothetical protein
MEGRKNGDIFSGTSVNLSESGILIETNKPLSLGEEITVHLILPSEEEIVGKGTVVRQEEWGFDKFGYAVRWELTLAEKELIARLIEGLKR